MRYPINIHEEEEQALEVSNETKLHYYKKILEVEDQLFALKDLLDSRDAEIDKLRFNNQILEQMAVEYPENRLIATRFKFKLQTPMIAGEMPSEVDRRKFKEELMEATSITSSNHD